MQIFEAVFSQVPKLEDIIGYKQILKAAISSVQILGPAQICVLTLEAFIGHVPVDLETTFFFLTLQLWEYRFGGKTRKLQQI